MNLFIKETIIISIINMKGHNQDSTLLEIEQKLLEINNKIKLIKSSDRADICLIGKTGAGKSSLISYLQSNEVNWEMKRGRFLGTINGNGPQIGNSLQSETTNLEEYKDESLGRIIDNPGFNDTRGPVQDITNSYLISSQFHKGKILKLLLVVEYSDLVGSKGNNLCQTLNLLIGIFEKERSSMDFADCCAIVVSKVPQEARPSQIVKTISQIARSHKDKIEQLGFVEKIISKRNGVLLFPMPNRKTLKIDQTAIIQLKEGVKYLKQYRLKQKGSLKLSHQSKYYIQELAHEASTNLGEKSELIANDLHQKLENPSTNLHHAKAIIMQTFDRPQTLNTIQLNLKQLNISEDIINETLPQLKKLEVCNTLDAGLITKRAKQQFQQKLMEPIRYRADKIKQNKEMQEQAREMINSVQKFQEENLREEIEMQKQILINMNKNAQEISKNARYQAQWMNDTFQRVTKQQEQNHQDLLQWQKQRQRSIPSIPIMPVVQELPRKQRKKKEVVKEVDSSFQQCQWQNYRVQITEQRICDIM